MDKLMCYFDGEAVPKEMCFFDRESKTEPDDCMCCNEACAVHSGQSCTCTDAGCPVQKAFNQLAKYEATNLTPEQILEIDKLYAEKCKEVAELEKMVAELKEAGHV